MKILYIAPEYPSPGENAAQVRANALLPRLAEQVDLRILAYPPHDVEVETSSDPALTPVGRGVAARGALLRATFSSRPRSFLRYDTAEARAAFAALLESFQPDVVHFDSVGTLALMGELARMPRPPKLVAHTHDAVSQLYARLAQSGPPLTRALARSEHRKFLRLEREELARCDAVIVDSPEDAAFLRAQTGGARVNLVPIGVDLTRFSPDGPRADLTHPAIVFSGSMASEQSADAAQFLVGKIMPRLWQHYPDAHVYLVGSNPVSVVSALEGDRVHITGFVDDLTRYLRAADVYVCPLRLGSGMRTRVIEALACGARAVSTSFGVRGLAQDEGGDLPWLTADTADAMATAMAELLGGARPDLGEHAAAYAVGNYSWDGVAAQIVEIYEGLLSNG